MLASLISSVVFSSASLAALPAEPTGPEQQVQREYRLFRVQVYHTYRVWRPEYDQRRETGERAYQAWKQAGGQAHQAKPLLAWYQWARYHSHPRINRPLPDLPAFPEAKTVQLPAARQVEPSPPAENVSTHYRVRRVDAPRAGGQRQPRKPAWKSVSKALLKGMVFGVSRTER